VRIGWPDKFIEHGQVDDLRKKHGISVEAALEQVRPLLVSRSRSTLAAG
jgi:1-deoxy-D-xylulose-5-phosphate synthase